ncbi:MAG TPA: hypothetical protein VF170_12970 [Planctomycetaceae bacterium]
MSASPAEARVPAYHPDAAEVRRGRAPAVRVAAAELVGRYDARESADKAVGVLLAAADYETTDEYAATHALLVLDELLAARPAAVAARADRIEALPLPGDRGKEVNPRAREYPARLKATIIERLAGRE